MGSKSRGAFIGHREQRRYNARTVSTTWLSAIAFLALSVAGCTTTAVTRAGLLNDGGWLRRRAGDVVSVEAEAHSVDVAGSSIVATSPTDVRIVGKDGQVTDVRQVHTLRVVNHGKGALDGAGIGFAAGIPLGVVLGLLYAGNKSASYDSCRACDPGNESEKGFVLGATTLLFSVAAGAGLGALIGHIDELDLR
jgi:hypothetical protein